MRNFLATLLHMAFGTPVAPTMCLPSQKAKAADQIQRAEPEARARAATLSKQARTLDFMHETMTGRR